MVALPRARVDPIERWPRWKLALCMASLYLAPRALARATGLRFDDSALELGWQQLDPRLLKDRLLESLYYLHAQPPLFNLFLGIVLKLTGTVSRFAFEGLFYAMGALLYVVIFTVMRRLGVSRPCALLTATLFAASPSCILYESWLSYTLPLALLVGLSALALANLVERRSIAACAAFFGLVAALCATHGIFHLFYLAACVAAVLRARLLPRRAVVATATLPLLLVTAIYAKNAALFGEFTTSTWMGMNIAIRRVTALPVPERDSLIARGALSDVASVRPFKSIEDYPPRYAAVPPRFADVPALADAHKASGQPNLNHFGYIAIAKSYAADTKYVLAHYPAILVQSLLRGWYEYFRSSSDYWFLEPNIASSSFLRVWCRLFDFFVYGVVLAKSLGVILVLAIPLLIFVSLRRVYRPAAAAAPGSTQRILLLFCAGTTAYVALVANTLNALENMRLRFMTDPLIVILAAYWLEHRIVPGLRELRSRRGRRSSAAALHRRSVSLDPKSPARST